MGAIVAQQLQRIGMLAGDDRNLRVALDGGGEILEDAVDLDGQGRLGQARADRLGQLGARQRALERTAAAVRQRQGDHREQCRFMRGQAI